MNLLNSILILAMTFVSVFLEATFPVTRHLFGAQVDLLPALMVCAAFTTDLITVALVAIFGGLWFDSLSANPFGISILPLFVIGFLISLWRDLMLRELPFAQLFLGAAASAVAPVMTVLLLLSGGIQPLLGWGSLWQWIVMTAGGAVATPLLFLILEMCNDALGYKLKSQTSFRSDREILRTTKFKK
ncbi:MAG TPA: hypothetical protein VFV23_02255 [Verrucomicrobiae bacterium]|nr:hypothetical protein [Verrucomicrobiae bacterium]